MLRGTAQRNQQGEGPSIQSLYAPETLKAAWVGSPIRPWVAWAIPVAVLGLLLLVMVG